MRDLRASMRRPKRSCRFTRDLRASVRRPKRVCKFTRDLRASVRRPKRSCKFTRDLRASVRRPKRSCKFTCDLKVCGSNADASRKFTRDLGASVRRPERTRNPKSGSHGPLNEVPGCRFFLYRSNVPLTPARRSAARSCGRRASSRPAWPGAGSIRRL